MKHHFIANGVIGGSFLKFGTPLAQDWLDYSTPLVNNIGSDYLSSLSSLFSRNDPEKTFSNGFYLQNFLGAQLLPGSPAAQQKAFQTFYAGHSRRLNNSEPKKLISFGKFVFLRNERKVTTAGNRTNSGNEYLLFFRMRYRGDEQKC